MIYLFILVILLFGFLFEEKMKRRGTRFLWYFSFMYLTALSAFGYRIGADMPAYIGEFDFYKIDFSPSYLFSFHRRQPLWVLLCVWCKSLGGGFEMLKIIHAVVLNICVFRFISKHSKNRLLGVLIYYVIFYLHFNFNAIRSSLALALFLMSYDYLLERKYIKYYFIAIVTFLVHESAIILFLYPLFFFIKIREERLSRVAFIVFIICLLVIPLAYIIRDQITSIFLILQALGVVDYGESYFENDYYTGFALSLAGIIEFIFTLLLYLFVVKNNAKRIDKEHNIEIVLLFLYMIIFAANTVFPILYRFNDYISILFVCAVSNTITSIKIGTPENILTKKIVLISTIIFLNLYPLFVTTVQYHARPIVQFYPYFSIFDKKISPEREKIWGGKEYIEYIY